jgi:hypothetical protein
MIVDCRLKTEFYKKGEKIAFIILAESPEALPRR